MLCQVELLPPRTAIISAVTGRCQTWDTTCARMWHHVAVQRKIFWILVLLLGTITDIVLPIWWALAAFIPVVALSWWVAYRSDWF